MGQEDGVRELVENEVSTEDQIKARERLDILVAEKKVTRRFVDKMIVTMQDLRRSEEDYDELVQIAVADGIDRFTAELIGKDVMKMLGFTRNQIYHRLKAIEDSTGRNARTAHFDDNKVQEQSLTSAKPEVENITTVSSTNVIVDEENVMDDSQDARSESKIQAEVAASMITAANDTKPVWHSMDRVQLIELVEATRDDNERNSGRCEELENRNRDLFEEIRRLKKALFVQEEKAPREIELERKMPSGFVMIKESELADLRKQTRDRDETIKGLNETLKATEIERDDFKEAATKSSFHNAVPKAGRIRVNPHDFIDVFHLANIKRQEVNLDHDGLRVTNAVRITGGERR